MGLTTAKKANGKKVREMQDDEESVYLYERQRLDETIDRHLHGNNNDNPYLNSSDEHLRSSFSPSEGLVRFVG